MRPTAPSTHASTGDDVLDWLRTDDARAQARRIVGRVGLPGGAAMVDDLLAEATMRLLVRMRSTTPLHIDSPGGYGTQVLRSVAARLIGGRDACPPDELGDDVPAPSIDAHDPTAGDGVRSTIEQLGATDPWLTSAALTYLTLVMHPSATADGWPRPAAGSAPEHALAWPALWLAGERSIFPVGGHDPQRRTRARRIAKVRQHVEAAFARVRAQIGGDHG